MSASGGGGGGGGGGGNQPQFRYTQPPSKVLHVRNLPWECAEEELVELCKPFGKIVNTKMNVGANHNQAFVEFENLNQAIAMVSYYASSSEPAQVRGKAVYLQYSTRQEIVTTKQSGDVASNVLLVTIEGVEAGDVSIDVLHLVFSAFGFVHKIATFEKSAGFQQALVQFGDPTTASAAKSALEGRSIPKYLLPEHVTQCSLRISFSAHNDLNVKFQSHRSRDYTNPYLPVAPSATDASGQRREPESNVLLASIENMQYAVTIDVLHTVFSAFGTVQKIAIFEKTAGFQALVQYPDVTTAVAAKDALEGHCIYDGGYCKLRLSFSRHTDLNVKANSDRSRDYTQPQNPPTPAAGGADRPASGGGPPPGEYSYGAPTGPHQQDGGGGHASHGQGAPTAWDYEQAHAIAAKGITPGGNMYGGPPPQGPGLYGPQGGSGPPQGPPQGNGGPPLLHGGGPPGGPPQHGGPPMGMPPGPGPHGPGGPGGPKQQGPPGGPRPQQHMGPPGGPPMGGGGPPPRGHMGPLGPPLHHMGGPPGPPPYGHQMQGPPGPPGGPRPGGMPPGPPPPGSGPGPNYGGGGYMR